MSNLEIWQLLIAVFAIVVTVAGWLYEKAKDRQHEIFKERLKRWLDMYDNVIAALLPFINAANANGSVDASAGKDLGTARTKMQLFGYTDEKDAFERFLSTITSKDTDGLKNANYLRELTSLILSKLRSELGYK